MKIYHVERILWQKISNWAQLVIISFSSAVRVSKRYSKNQNIFGGLFEHVEKIMVKNYWVTQKKYSCLIKHKMHNKRRIFKIKIVLDYQ